MRILCNCGTLALISVAVMAQRDPYTRQKEAAIGASMANDVREHTIAVSDSVISNYLKRLGARLAGHLPDSDIEWEFAVIRDDVGGSTHEPGAFPDGYIFVSLELLRAVDNKSELSGMLAHSMAHVTERHGLRTPVRGQVANLSSIPLVFNNWSGGNDPPFAMPLAYVKFWRSYDQDADRIAAHAIAEAGYGPASLVTYIRRTQRATDWKKERVTVLESVVATLPSRAGLAPAEDDFRAMQARARELAVPLETHRKPPSLYREDEH